MFLSRLATAEARSFPVRACSRDAGGSSDAGLDDAGSTVAARRGTRAQSGRAPAGGQTSSGVPRASGGNATLALAITQAVRACWLCAATKATAAVLHSPRPLLSSSSPFPSQCAPPPPSAAVLAGSTPYRSRCTARRSSRHGPWYFSQTFLRRAFHSSLCPALPRRVRLLVARRRPPGLITVLHELSAPLDHIRTVVPGKSSVRIVRLPLAGPPSISVRKAVAIHKPSVPPSVHPPSPAWTTTPTRPLLIARSPCSPANAASHRWTPHPPSSSTSPTPPLLPILLSISPTSPIGSPTAAPLPLIRPLSVPRLPARCSPSLPSSSPRRSVRHTR
ncbi:hypothetical protein K466DRAFT_53220 [Polyporus arcularius HHB13444]|uniref:Uncharacterized protein n=1 Tax=Polyporus arcularius HHB13444 TaxID=1314778 RepID=A0A5C3PJ45_9APHY|nr:hypothetical protein K466DRAFT_53220 [Polyporus arcularius HHB13444]